VVFAASERASGAVRAVTAGATYPDAAGRASAKAGGRNCLTLEAFRLIRRADQHAGNIRQSRRNRAHLLSAGSSHGGLILPIPTLRFRSFDEIPPEGQERVAFLRTRMRGREDIDGIWGAQAHWLEYMAANHSRRCRVINSRACCRNSPRKRCMSPSR
jgi:hypothetical protein